MDQRGKPDGADHGQHPVFGHQRQCAGKAEQDSGLPAPLLERIEISEHDERQGDELEQVGIVLETLEIEDRVERDHHHDQERAPRIHHAQRDEPADHHTGADGRHRQRIGRPVRRREHCEPEPGDPARQRRVLAVAPEEFLAPAPGFRDVHVNVLRGLEINQDEGPEHRMQDGELDHQPQARLGAGRAGNQPGPKAGIAHPGLRARSGRRDRGRRHGPGHQALRSAFPAFVESAWREQRP
ncbi:hypothetical protein ACVWWO_005449 [Bradyrhizobium sp. F1.13.1]